eukprot:CAMPEP_0177670742 /NCGR_PEP_ID=MMETSP0447-20121125/24272_1 /TAXON_ID=0 /ORGANISM="Stygamoeba regulata, Strain BSH-02190019" /LENGTH=216 /DNA_ID=CAMNT_0019177967 /DNA_START=222 /DNA_END=872 /DNA_ORIENTATION=-
MSHIKAQQGEAPVGKVIIQDRNVKLQLQDVGGTFPNEYGITLTTDPNPIHIISQDASGALSVEGRVEKKGELKPVELTQQYRELCKERTHNVRALKRTTLPTDGRLVDAEGIYPKMLGLPQHMQKRNTVIDKRERMDRVLLENKLFALFEEKQLWSLRDLINATNQPAVWLREVLAQISFQNKQMPNKNLYELKPEYQNAKKTEGGGTEMQDTFVE